MDTISVGMTISFVVECFKSGILRSEDTYGIELRSSSAEALAAVAEEFARRAGFRNVLAGRAKRTPGGLALGLSSPF